jgi:hypothetical protein
MATGNRPRILDKLQVSGAAVPATLFERRELTDVPSPSVREVGGER